MGKRPYRQYLGQILIFKFGLAVVPFKYDEATDTFDVVVTNTCGAHMIGDIRYYMGEALDNCVIMFQ